VAFARLISPAMHRDAASLALAHAHDLLVLQLHDRPAIPATRDAGAGVGTLAAPRTGAFHSDLEAVSG
jgi:hypothetical protein